MEKSRDAFRTISEVAGWLDVPTHVLRFWESRFSQIKPVKRAGGRRYYRPSDMALIGGIKTLLHDQGMTIRGVQKMLREQGIKHVSSFSPPLHPDDEIEASSQTVIEGTAVALEEAERPASIPAPAARTTHGAEPTPEDEDAEAEVQHTPVEANETEEDQQPDMFPEAPATDREPAPMFSHRERAADPKPEPEPEPEPERLPTARAIPATPHVPDQDPLDEDENIDFVSSASARLLKLDATEIAKRQDAIGPVAARLKQLRERMAE